MGKPTRSSLKRKQQLKRSAKISENLQDKDEAMEQASSLMKPKLDENTQTTSKPTEVVLEDIRLHDCILKSKVSKKKEKRRLRRNNLLAKLQSSDTVRIQTKKAKKRAKTVIVGDMQPLMDALPALSNFPDEYTTTKAANKLKLSGREKKKNWSNKKWKTKKNEELQDINLFKKVLQLPEFKQDPISAITSHVGYMVKGNLL